MRRKGRLMKDKNEYLAMLKKGKIKETDLRRLDLQIKGKKMLLQSIDESSNGIPVEEDWGIEAILESARIRIRLIDEIAELSELRDATITYNLEKNIKVLEKGVRFANKLNRKSILKWKKR